MKLLLDDKQHNGHNLNANEACIFAAILKCTRAGRGWYGNYRVLAAAMPFVMSHETARRAVQKLLNLGLIERREEKLFTLTQIVTDDAQNVTELTQNVTSDAQNVPPLNNPPINNNMNEKEKEQQHALCARDCDEQQDCLFEKFFKKFAHEFRNRYAVTNLNFGNRTEAAQLAMWDAVKDEPDGSVDKNPYFFVQDFPDPKPVFLRGDEPGDLVQVRYGDRIKICTRATMELFGLEWYADWNS